jgi:hypothetical protein
MSLEHAGQQAPGPPRSPWILIDDLTVEHAAAVLERLTDWLTAAQTSGAADCAHALSLGETSDTTTIASWTEALAARLRHRAEQGQL